MVSIRPAAVAGAFYPANPRELAREVDAMLGHSVGGTPVPAFPKALIVPHAGYVYSGGVAAEAYDRLHPARGIVRRVVLLGPCHRVPVRGLALPEAAAFATPLGRVPIDLEAIESLAGLPQVVVSGAVHAEEHALEVQLPFLQRVLGEFSLVPLAVGAATPEEVSEVIEKLWGGEETLIVISSDLSHYHSYDEACAIDRGTAQAILDYSTDIDHEQACGATPVAGLLLAAKRHELEVELLDSRNSGDTAGGRARVVGYASFAFWDGAPGYAEQHRRTLLEIARNSIEVALGASKPKLLPDESWLKPARASFVTLTQDGRLRGCIGSLEAQRPLGEDVRHNARAAALSDPRFPPLTREELAGTRIEVSLLSTPKLLAFADHADLIAQLRPGEDGLILECGEARATFLPQVWEGLPDAEQFVAELKRKAGLLPGVSTAKCRIQRYRVLKWKEEKRKDDSA
ncbi:MAG: AmmeMemoRadiSam system protein B [Betaproteobacteria bacterium]|nr:MAG: AmmeMemoRadiSam system protein B [Betaproteobacteria bacterium]